jgi:DNA-binding NarL/FixJ family response regulator
MDNNSDAIKVIIVDDHPLFRQGVIDVLKTSVDINVIAEASNGEEGLRLIRSLHPDVAIVDINLPGINGQQITLQGVQEKLPTRFMLLTAYDDLEQVLHSAWAGAAGYCSKDIEPVKLIQAIHEIYQGNYYLEERIFTESEFKNWIENRMKNAHHLYSEPGSPFHPLSSREMEVLSCVVDGRSNKEIAVSLGISHQTVKNHVTSILRKFAVEDRTQAVVYALKHGWVQLSDDKIKDSGESYGS